MATQDSELTLDATLDQGADLRTQAKELSTGPQPPPVLAGYILHSRLGAGTFGEAWSGTQLSTGQKVAVKVFSRHQALDWNLFRAEVQRLIEVAEHPNVVSLLDANLEHTPPFFVMPLLAGSLADVQIAQGQVHPRGWKVEQMAVWLDEVCQGLGYIHSKGILHGDLKPANLLLDQEGRARLADFGQSFATQAGGYNLGTLGYMSPEQILRALGHAVAPSDPRWDVYALGATAYRILGGQVPRLEERTRVGLSTCSAHERLQIAFEVSQAPLRPLRELNSDVDRELAAIIQGCLEPLPGFRYPNTQAILEDLKRRKDRLPLHIRRPWSPIYRLALLARRSPVPIAIGLFFTLLLLGTVSLGWREVRRERDAVEARQNELASASKKLDGKASELKAELESFQHIETALGLAAEQHGRGAEAVLWWAQALRHSPASPGLPFLLASYRYPLEIYLQPDQPVQGLALNEQGSGLADWQPGGRFEVLGQGQTQVGWHRPNIEAAVWAPAGELFTTGNSSGQLVRWKATPRLESVAQSWLVDPLVLGGFLARPRQATCVLLACSPDGKTYLSANAAGQCRLEPGGATFQLEGAPRSAIFSADSRRLAVLTEGGAMVVRSLPEGRPCGPALPARQACLDQHGTSLVWLDSQAQAHHSEVSSGSRLADLGWARQTAFVADRPVTDGWLAGVFRFTRFSADGRRLAAVQGSALRVYDSLSHQPVSPMLQHSAEIQQLALSRRGDKIATYDGRLRLFGSRPELGWQRQLRFPCSQFLLGQGRLALQQGQQVVVLDLATGKPLETPQTVKAGPLWWSWKKQKLLVEQTGPVLVMPGGEVVRARGSSYQFRDETWPTPEPIVSLTRLSDAPVAVGRSGLTRGGAGLPGKFRHTLPLADSLLAVDDRQMYRLVAPVREDDSSSLETATTPGGFQVDGLWPQKSPVSALAGHDDLVLAARADGSCVLWKMPGRRSSKDAPQPQPQLQSVSELPHSRPIRLAALAPGGQLACTVDDLNQVRVWLTGRQLSLDLPEELARPSLQVLQIHMDQPDSLWIRNAQEVVQWRVALDKITAAKAVKLAEGWTGLRLGPSGKVLNLSPAEWGGP